MNKEQKKQIREILQEIVNNEVYIKLVNFILKNKSEYHWQFDEDVVLFVDFAEATEFYKIFDNAYTVDKLQVVLCDGFFAVEMKQIADRFEFDLEYLFELKNE